MKKLFNTPSKAAATSISLLVFLLWLKLWTILYTNMSIELWFERVVVSLMVAILVPMGTAAFVSLIVFGVVGLWKVINYSLKDYWGE